MQAATAETTPAVPHAMAVRVASSFNARNRNTSEINAMSQQMTPHAFEDARGSVNHRNVATTAQNNDLQPRCQNSGSFHLETASQTTYSQKMTTNHHVSSLADGVRALPAPTDSTS